MDLSNLPDRAENDAVSPDSAGAPDVTTDRDEPSDAVDASDSSVMDASDSAVADRLPMDLGAPTDAGPSPDARSDRDVGDVSSCAVRALPGACTPGPGCDILDVAIGGGTSSNGVVCAVFTGGSVRCWSPSGYTLLGNGTSMGCLAPGLVRDLTGVQSVRAGDDFACVVRPGETAPVWCWGNNSGSSLGIPSPSESRVPIATPIPAGELSLGGSTGFSISAAGGVSAWGGNAAGQHGDGTTALSSMYVAPHTVPLTGLRQVALSRPFGLTAPMCSWVVPNR